MRGLVFSMIELAVLHTGACAHALHVAWRNTLDVTQRVLVGQIAAHHVADDFHVAVAMGAKTGARGNAVFIDDAQVAKPHVGRVVVTGKRKAVERLEPAMVGQAAVVGFSELQHGLVLQYKGGVLGLSLGAARSDSERKNCWHHSKI